MQKCTSFLYNREMKTTVLHRNKNLIIVLGECSIPKCTSSILHITDFDWNDTLSPWPAKAIRKGDRDFGGHSKVLLHYIQNLDLSKYEHVYTCGYSLAGLFALYACIILNLDGCVCCSASFWYPEFIPFVKKNTMANKRIYLSLGSKENKSRNIVMASVKDCTEEIYKTLVVDNTCVFEMNPGNHFSNVDQRIEKGIVWLENGI